MTRISWKKRAAAEDDKHQTELAPSSIRGIRSHDERRKLEVTMDTSIVSCPFCLYTAKTTAFLVQTKKGYSYALAKCPDCKNGMRMESLTSNWTPEQYAEWCYEYAASGFWQKVPFNKWKERLNKIGIAGKFWARYKELKHEGEEESIEEYYERVQREQHEQETS